MTLPPLPRGPSASRKCRRPALQTQRAGMPWTPLQRRPSPARRPSSGSGLAQQRSDARRQTISSVRQTIRLRRQRRFPITLTCQRPSYRRGASAQFVRRRVAKRGGADPMSVRLAEELLPALAKGPTCRSVRALPGRRQRMPLAAQPAPNRHHRISASQQTPNTETPVLGLRLVCRTGPR